MALATNIEHHQRTKLIDVRYYFIKEKEEDRTIAINYVPTDSMIADKLTKAWTPARMKVFIKQMEMQRA